MTRLREEAIAAERAGKPLELTAWIEFSADEDAATDDIAQLRPGSRIRFRHARL